MISPSHASQILNGSTRIYEGKVVMIQFGTLNKKARVFSVFKGASNNLQSIYSFK